MIKINDIIIILIKTSLKYISAFYLLVFYKSSQTSTLTS